MTSGVTSILTFLITFNAVCGCMCILHPFSNEFPPRASLAKCVLEASKLYFQIGEVVNFVLPPEEVDADKPSPILLSTVLLSRLANQGEWPITINRPSNNADYYHELLLHQTYGNYIMQIRHVDNITDYIHFLRLKPSWNPHGRFIVIGMFVNRNGLQPDSPIVRIITALWKHNVINGVLLLPKWENSSEYNVFSWFPYEGGACGDLVDNIRQIDTCSYGDMKVGMNWFPEKLPRYFNNCGLSIRTLLFPPYVMGAKKMSKTDSYEFEDGFDIRLINYVAGVLKLVPTFSMSGILNDWGYVTPEHGGTGVLGSVATFQYDAALGSMSATPERNAVLDSTTSYLQDALSFCVPHAESKSQWKRIVQILGFDTWIVIILCILILTTIIYRLSLVEPSELNMYKDYGANLQRMFAITLGAAINIQPRSTKVRFLIMQWIFISLCLDTAFQTYLISVVTTPDYEPQIKTLDGILTSDLHVLILEAAERFYKRQNNGPGDQIMSRFERCPDLDDCLSRAATKRDAVVVAPRLFTKYAMKKYIRPNGGSLLYCFEDSIVTFPIVIYLQRGFPLTKRISNVVEIVVSSGYFELWRHSIFSKKIVVDFEAIEEEAELKKEALTLFQLQVAFLLFVGGFGFSLLVFGVEVLYYKINKKTKQIYN